MRVASQLRPRCPACLEFLRLGSGTQPARPGPRRPPRLAGPFRRHHRPSATQRGTRRASLHEIRHHPPTRAIAGELDRGYVCSPGWAPVGHDRHDAANGDRGAGCRSRTRKAPVRHSLRPPLAGVADVLRRCRRFRWIPLQLRGRQGAGRASEADGGISGGGDVRADADDAAAGIALARHLRATAIGVNTSYTVRS